MGKILFPLPRRGRGKKNGFSSDFDTFSSSEGRGKNSPFFFQKKGPEIGGNNGSFRAPISDRCPEGTSKTRVKKTLRAPISDRCPQKTRVKPSRDRAPENCVQFSGAQLTIGCPYDFLQRSSVPSDFFEIGGNPVPRKLQAILREQRRK